MSDPHDLGMVAQVRSPHPERPVIYLWEAVPGGVGLAPRLFERTAELVDGALGLVEGCDCQAGCPACVGPRGEPAVRRRALARAAAAPAVRAAASPRDEPSWHCRVAGSRPWSARGVVRLARARAAARAAAAPQPLRSSVAGAPAAWSPRHRSRGSPIREPRGRRWPGARGQRHIAVRRLGRGRRARTPLPVGPRSACGSCRSRSTRHGPSCASTPRRPGWARPPGRCPSSSASVAGAGMPWWSASCCCPTMRMSPRSSTPSAAHPARRLAGHLQRPGVRLAAARQPVSTPWSSAAARSPTTSTCCRLARQVWRHRLPDARLASVEAGVAGVRRHGDLPGALIPERYFDYLRTRRRRAVPGRPGPQPPGHRLAGAAPARPGARGAAGAPPVGDPVPPRDLMGLGRLYATTRAPRGRAPVLRDRAGAAGPAVAAARAAGTAWGGNGHAPWAAWDDAMRRVRRGRRSRSKAGPAAPHAWIQVAKWLEHGARDIPGATQAARRADTLAARLRYIGQPQPGVERDLVRRLARLARRAAASPTPARW